MALRTRGDYYDADTRIVTPLLVPASRLVSSITGLDVQRNKAIVGRNAFAHEAGIHQDGMLKEPSTYEIMRPEDVGFAKTDLVLGKHSGRAALADRAATLGYPLEGDDLKFVFEEFKKLADKKKEVYDADIVALVERRQRISESQWRLVSYHVDAQSTAAPKASVVLEREGEQLTAHVEVGDGPLDALFLALEQATGITVAVRDFRVHSVTRGQDAQGESTIEAEYQGQLYRGRGVSTDTVEASVLAFVNVLNRIEAHAGSPLDVDRGDTV